jgi:hypothetical protein
VQANEGSPIGVHVALIKIETHKWRYHLAGIYIGLTPFSELRVVHQNLVLNTLEINVFSINWELTINLNFVVSYIRSRESRA